MMVTIDTGTTQRIDAYRFGSREECIAAGQQLELALTSYFYDGQFRLSEWRCYDALEFERYGTNGNFDNNGD